MAGVEPGAKSKRISRRPGPGGWGRGTPVRDGFVQQGGQARRGLAGESMARDRIEAMKGREYFGWSGARIIKINVILDTSPHETPEADNANG